MGPGDAAVGGRTRSGYRKNRTDFKPQHSARIARRDQCCTRAKLRRVPSMDSKDSNRLRLRSPPRALIEQRSSTCIRFRVETTTPHPPPQRTVASAQSPLQINSLKPRWECAATLPGHRSRSCAKSWHSFGASGEFQPESPRLVLAGGGGRTPGCLIFRANGE